MTIVKGERRSVCEREKEREGERKKESFRDDCEFNTWGWAVVFYAEKYIGNRKANHFLTFARCKVRTAAIVRDMCVINENFWETPTIIIVRVLRFEMKDYIFFFLSCIYRAWKKRELLYFDFQVSRASLMLYWSYDTSQCIYIRS